MRADGIEGMIVGFFSAKVAGGQAVSLGSSVRYLRDVVLCCRATNLLAYFEVGSKMRPTVMRTMMVPTMSAWFWIKNSVLRILGELLVEVPMRRRMPIVCQLVV